MRGWDRGREWLPPGYRLDTSDGAAWVLRRSDGTATAYFGAWGATREAVERAARDDHRRTKRRTPQAPLEVMGVGKSRLPKRLVGRRLVRNPQASRRCVL